MQSQSRSGVTRSDVIPYVIGAFGSGDAVFANAIVVHAAEHGAPEPVRQLLLRLPERSYRRPNELWDALPEVPVGE